jgi:hypothetical protein
MAKHLNKVMREEWLSCQYPGTMMVWLRTADARKLRLFACACCRRIWERMSDPERKLVETAERWADGHISRIELQTIRDQLKPHLPTDRFGELPRSAKAALATATPRKTALRNLLADVAVCQMANIGDGDHLKNAHAHHSLLLHDIFDYLFLRTLINPNWLTWNDGTVGRIAQAIYDERAFDRLPILADALEDAGCDNADILNHCRQPGVHVRGCWVVDLLLEKE